jgi:hypothetical protein
MMTFLVDENFRTSAALLDSRRLGKQRVEALQILVLLRKIHLVALLLKIVVPPRETSTIEKRKWIKDLVGVYKKSPVKIIVARNGIVNQTEYGEYDKLGWYSHPIVAMWFGYEEALVEYLHAHLFEWIERGFRNTMIFQAFQGKIIYPPWISDDRIHDNHRGALLKKEITRKEKEWYVGKREFLRSSPFEDYIWDI